MRTARAGMTLRCAATAVCLMTASCGSGSADSPSGCNTLVDDGPVITAMAVADTPAPAAGGKIADGTYVLSAVTLHTGPVGSTIAPAATTSGVFQVQGATMQQVGTVNGVETRSTSTFVTSGTVVTTKDTCPTPDTESYYFTATDAELRIYDSAAAGTVEQVYSLR